MLSSPSLSHITTNRTRWLILALLFVCRASLGVQFQTMGSVSSRLASELSLTFTEIGTLIGLFMLPGIVLALPSGYAARFTSDRTLVALGLAIMSAGGAIAAVAPGFGLLAAGRIASGVGFVISTIYFTKMVADWFVGKELATAMSILVMSWPFGIAMGQIGHEWLAGIFTWRTPFGVAAVYCAVATILVFLLYRPPLSQIRTVNSIEVSLPKREILLIVLASVVWAAFNAAYIVYLSFAPRILMSGGYTAVQAATIISLASWVMIFSGAICGHVADRTGKPDRILYVCVVAAIVSLLLLPFVSLAVILSLTFGILGMAPAGVIMALTGQAIAPGRRAFGMGVFFTSYFLLVTPAPAIAGWLYDQSGNAYWPILFAAVMFGMTALGNFVFRVAHQRLSRSHIAA